MKSGRLLGQVAAAHFVSHVHIMAVPALLPLLPKAMGVGFVELGVAIAVFNIVSALVQAPLGFMVDKWGARRMLMAALSLGALSFGLLALVPTYHCLLLAMGAAGLANGVYHPADYALLSQGTEAKKMGRAFSIHTFAGFLGAASTPPLLVGVALWLSVSHAFAVATVLALIALLFLYFYPAPAALSSVSPQEVQANRARPIKIPLKTIAGLTLLFLMLSLSTGGLEKFSAAALVEGFDINLRNANQALTAFLFASAVGVLSGGILADNTEKHGFLAAIAFAVAAVLVAVLIYVPLVVASLVVLLGMIGFLTGVVAPSRDMLVRAASPVGAEGRTFGIVSTGFNMGGVVGPLLFGYLLDQQVAVGVFWAALGFMLITTALVIAQEFARPPLDKMSRSEA